jgi:hypothetical protein
MRDPMTYRANRRDSARVRWRSSPRPDRRHLNWPEFWMGSNNAYAQAVQQANSKRGKRRRAAQKAAA